jgi:hypothetical protein
VKPVPRPRRRGHEFVGVVEEVGADVRTVRVGDFVIAPFAISDGSGGVLPARRPAGGGRRFGATDVVELRGADGAAALRELFGGVGPDAVLECVGTQESMAQALATVRPGGNVGYVGVPAGAPELPIGTLFGTNVAVGGGVAPVRAYLPELLAEVLAGTLDPSPVLDLELPLAQAAEAYAAMDDRRTIKPLLRP